MLILKKISDEKDRGVVYKQKSCRFPIRRPAALLFIALEMRILSVV